ncbi:hypothetical protein [Streptomyces lomondensis]|uniref:Uncharacterized protein n=1 Tax=Streptomyces lomondensis TaxID=68229 RepID=A0ABQ2WXU4_9ACTN|nr:hypothetical protein [Streptomyces lomondensis]MCF0078871.1 hypothetical protein [Streptomyces lomondensis]GGW81704.1 hypothetical protein GCM10010383_07100 [Streptomyces lomondensis]
MSTEQFLVKAFASLLVSIDLTDDDDLDPDVASQIVEPIAAMARDLEPPERAELASLIRTAADSETDPVRQRSMRTLPEDIGLLDEN